jgi:hypothetical protein
MKQSKKMFSVALLILAIIVLGTGCSMTRGRIGHEIQTQVQLSQANFDVISSATGEAQADYFLGIGPSDQDLFGQATRQMILRAQLKGSQALVNLTTDTKYSGLFFWRQKKVYVSADIVQFK